MLTSCSLMTSASRSLVQRHRKSLNEYFEEIPDDRLLAMAVNPFLATRGCKDILAIKGQVEGGKLISRMKSLLKVEVEKFLAKIDCDIDDVEGMNRHVFLFRMFLTRLTFNPHNL